MKVTVDQAFWDLFPTATITVMSLVGIDNTVDEAKDPYFKELLDKGAKRAWEFIDEDNYTQSEFVQEWRQAFTKFKTKKGAVCRCLNWREAQRTMLTEDTKDAILVIEAINDEQAKRAQTAMQELKDLAKEYFGVEGTIYQLNAQQASLEV